jgi:hypothetical protein
MGRLRLFGELVEAGGAIEGGGSGEGGGGGGHQIARVVRTSGDYQTTSTAFTDIDTSNLVINLTTGDSWVLLILAGSLYVTSIQYGCLDFTVDDERVGGDKGVQQSQACYAQDLQIAWLMQVTAGSHVFRPQWRVTGGAGILRARSIETPLLFAIIEMR